MSRVSHNIHGTAVTIDGIGLLFLGPSGSGKSGLAFDCLAEARLAGLSAALISDDRVLVSRDEGGRVIGRGPEQIRGLMELRYCGIVDVEHVVEAPLHYVAVPVGANEKDRLPPENEHAELIAGTELPVIRVPGWSRFPLSLIRARIRGLERNS